MNGPDGTAHPTVLPWRASAAVRALRTANRLSRSLGRGSGTVAGGRVGLALDPSLLATLARGHRVALVTGTNGKTTTTRMLVAALSAPPGPPVVSNDTGANMPAGHVAALAGAPAGADAVLEVDEGYLGRLIEETHPRVVVLLNLSRDQLDRISEVRMLVERWRAALGRLPRGPGPEASGTVVVANADDPMVAWAAAGRPRRPVGGGRAGVAAWTRWGVRPAAAESSSEGPGRGPATGAPSPVPSGPPGWRAPIWCWPVGSGSRWRWACPASSTGPMPPWWSWPRRSWPVLPATCRGPRSTVPASDPRSVLARVAAVDQVAGRFSSTVRRGRPVRLLLAKNPAGWTAIFDLLEEELEEERTAGGPLVLSVNARTADGFDTSWLWDVPFERLAGRTVVATGDRRLDLAVRLRYAEVATAVVADPLAAVDRAVDTPAGSAGSAGSPATVDFVGNYTAFADLRDRV